MQAYFQTHAYTAGQRATASQQRLHRLTGLHCTLRAGAVTAEGRFQGPGQPQALQGQLLQKKSTGRRKQQDALQVCFLPGRNTIVLSKLHVRLRVTELLYRRRNHCFFCVWSSWLVAHVLAVHLQLAYIGHGQCFLLVISCHVERQRLLMCVVPLVQEAVGRRGHGAAFRAHDHDFQGPALLGADSQGDSPADMIALCCINVLLSPGNATNYFQSQQHHRGLCFMMLTPDIAVWSSSSSPSKDSEVLLEGWCIQCKQLSTA